MDRDTLLGVLADARVTAFRQDADLRFQWISNPPAGWRITGEAGQTDADVLPPAAAVTVAAAKREVLSTGRPRWVEFALEDEGTTRSFDLFARPDRDAGDAVTGVVGIVIERTDRRRRSATLDAIAREMSHRSKNLLAIVQSLATHTAQASATTGEFVERFRGRIQALALSEDFPSGTSGPGRALAELVRAQVAPCLIDPDRVVFEGNDVTLGANATLHVGLALHELCVGSVRFGALGLPDGTARVRSEMLPDGSLRLTWGETAASLPDFERFARVLLERIVPAAVGGTATLAAEGDGWRHSLTIAAEEFAAG